MDITKKQAMQLAEFVLELTCANGIRYRGGKYVKVYDFPRLQRLVAERLREFEFKAEPVENVIDSLIKNMEGGKESA